MTSCREILISPGNILNQSIDFGQRKEPSDELFDNLMECVWMDGHMSDAGNILEFSGADGANNNEGYPVDRLEMKVAIKLFLYTFDRNSIIGAVEKGLKATSMDYLDHVVLVLTMSDFRESNLTLDEVMRAWNVLEELVADGKIKMIGLSDIDTQLFMDIHNTAKVKPGIVQINLSSCCIVPPELADFCMLHGIQLLTHSDPINLLPNDKFAVLLCHMQKPVAWKNYELSTGTLKWIIRYQIHIKCRGVLSSKGYVASISIPDPESK